MSKIEQNKYFTDIIASQNSHKFGGTYITADEMLTAVMTWADFNFDDWIYLNEVEKIEDVKLGDLKKLLAARIKDCEGYYKVQNGLYQRDPLVDFVRGE